MRPYCHAGGEAVGGSQTSCYGEPGTVLLLPTHYLLCITGNYATEKENGGGALGLRWGVLPGEDEQLDNIRATLKSTQDSYGKVSDDFITWIKCMEDITGEKVANSN